MLNPFPLNIDCDDSVNGVKPKQIIGLDLEEIKGKINLCVHLSDGSKMASEEANIFLEKGKIVKIEFGKMRQIIEIF